MRFLHGPRQDYVLKSARGRYRGSELEAEYAALLHYHRLNNPLIPVAQPHCFLQDGDWHHMLVSRCQGVPLHRLMRTADKHGRMEFIRRMAQTMRAVHTGPHVEADWHACLDGQLSFAEQHLQNGCLDPAEFIADGAAIEPSAMLHHLRASPPASGTICVLHGDYRPKNLLWHPRTRTISAVLDWAFCDVGDPSYDLAIILYYMKDEEERAGFLDNYGLPAIDEARLRYFEDLSKFTNV